MYDDLYEWVRDPTILYAHTLRLYLESEEKAVALAEVLSSENWKLHTLKVRCSDLTDGAATALADVLISEHCTLHKLSVNWGVVVRLADALRSKHCTLHTLEFNNDLHIKETTALAKALGALGRRSAAKPAVQVIGAGKVVTAESNELRQRHEDFKLAAKLLLLWSRPQGAALSDPVRELVLRKFLQFM